MTEETRKETRKVYKNIMEIVDIDFEKTSIGELKQILYKVYIWSEHEYHRRLYSNQDKEWKKI